MAYMWCLPACSFCVFDTVQYLYSMANRSLLCLAILVCAHAGPHFWDTAKSTTSDAFSACKSNRWCAIPVGTVTGAAAGVALVAAAPVVVGAVVVLSLLRAPCCP